MIKTLKKLFIFEESNNKLKNEINNIIEEIHTSFYTEVDNLLLEAKNINSLNSDKQELIDKCKRLKSLGFYNSKEVIEGEKEISRLKLLDEQNKNKKDLFNAIEYFSMKYPMYKFITEDSVKKICEKYNLIYGKIENYIGIVPTKNLEQIENFKIKNEDKCFTESIESGWRTNKEIISYTKAQMLVKQTKDKWGIHHNLLFFEAPLEIVAPLKDFNMKNMEIKDYKISKIEIPDPVVLKPVLFNNKKYYLIVTAWGIEAVDEIILNSNHN
jgi:hypothetical protein